MEYNIVYYISYNGIFRVNEYDSACYITLTILILNLRLLFDFVLFNLIWFGFISSHSPYMWLTMHRGGLLFCSMCQYWKPRALKEVRNEDILLCSIGWCVVLYRNVLCFAVLCCTVLCCTALEVLTYQINLIQLILLLLLLSSSIYFIC